MKFLRIQNSGELDVRLISLMGGSTKTGNTTKIGKFGTGLKYSIAWLIRNRIEFHIFVGSREVSMTVKEETIQDTLFEVIYIDGERSSITSNMGVDWEGWMVCREIWCNALDAGNGTHNLCVDTMTPDEGTTTFYIENVGQIRETVDNWDNYFMGAIEPIYKCDSFAIYPPGKTLCVYKNGVLIKREKDLRGLYSYDIKHAAINELREYKGYLPADVFHAVRSLPKELVMEFLSKVKPDHYEHDMDFEWSSGFTKTWEEALDGSKIIGSDDHDTMIERGMDIEATVVPQSIFNKLAENFPKLSAVRTVNKTGSGNSFVFHEQADEASEEKLGLALSLLKESRYAFSRDLSIVTGVFGNGQTHSSLDRDKCQILISMDLLQKPVGDVMGHIIKENEMFELDISYAQLGDHFAKLYALQLIK